MLFEEVDQFGKILLEKYPEGVFLSPWAYSHNEKRYPKSVLTYPNLVEAGNSRKTSHAYFRVPWPEDRALPEPIRLLGFYDTPDYPDPSLFRRLGRRIKISWPWESRKSRPTVMGPQKEKASNQERDHGYDLINSHLKISALFDNRDTDIIRFLDEIEQILLDITTCEFASYDPDSGAIINAKRQNKAQRYTAGVLRYAALQDRIYLGTLYKNGMPVELMGVRPEVRAAIRAEAGLPID